MTNANSGRNARSMQHPAGREESSGERLRKLADKWNPLLAEKARRDFLEDVNSLIRSQARLIRRTATAVDPARIENLAEQIASNRVFSHITRKRDFRAYVELYLMHTLGGSVGRTVKRRSLR